MSTLQLTLNIAIEKYKNTLDETELDILKLAKQQLQTSFSIESSIGFLEFIKNNNINIIYSDN